MIKAVLKLPDGRDVPVLIRERTYKKLVADFKQLSFWEKLKTLFK